MELFTLAAVNSDFANYLVYRSISNSDWYGSGHVNKDSAWGLNLIQDNINKSPSSNKYKPKIICVSKTFSLDKLYYRHDRIRKPKTKTFMV